MSLVKNERSKTFSISKRWTVGILVKNIITFQNSFLSNTNMSETFISPAAHWMSVYLFTENQPHLPLGLIQWQCYVLFDAPALTPGSKLVLNLPTPEGRKAELT